MGQAKKKRSCPAVGRDISSAECGENRNARYVCPAACAFNVFAVQNYDTFLALETQLDHATMGALARLHPDPRAFARQQGRAYRDHKRLGEHAVAMRAIFFERDASGRSVAERWLAEKDNRLSNDERVLLRGKVKARVALLEVRRIIDDAQIETVDLLDPERKTIAVVDRSLTGIVVRFQTLLTWIYPLPHYWRVSGNGVEAPEISGLSPLAVLESCVRHLGGPITPPAARHDWLVQHFERVCSAFQAVVLERKRKMARAMDGRYGSAFYALAKPMAECLAALDGERDVQHDAVDEEDEARGFTDARVWFAPDKGRPSRLGRHVLGRMVFKPDALRVDGVGGARLDELRAEVESRLGKRVRFTSERQEDIAAQMAERIPEVDVTLVPPELLEHTDSLQITTSRMDPPPADLSPEEYVRLARREELRATFDEPVPALNNLTPREAAARPQERPRLLEWAKGFIRAHDRANLREGISDNFMNESLRELGLDELDVPPPPARRPVDDDDELEAADMDDEAENLFGSVDAPMTKRPAPGLKWSAPALPAAPLTMEEASVRMECALDVIAAQPDIFENAEGALGAVLTEIADLLSEDVEEGEIGAGLALVTHVWLALVPRDEVPLLRFRVVRDAYEQEWEAFSKAAPKQAAEHLTRGSPQPVLLMLAIGEVFAATRDVKASNPLSVQSAYAIALAIKVLIAEIDHALRT